MPGVAFAFLAQVVEEAGASVWGGELGFVEAVEVVVRDEPEAAVSGKPAVQGGSAGMDPAERTSTRSPASSRSQPAAIWERPALWTQTKRTEGF